MFVDLHRSIQNMESAISNLSFYSEPTIKDKCEWVLDDIINKIVMKDIKNHMEEIITDIIEKVTHMEKKPHMEIKKPHMKKMEKRRKVRLRKASNKGKKYLDYDRAKEDLDLVQEHLDDYLSDQRKLWNNYKEEKEKIAMERKVAETRDVLRGLTKRQEKLTQKFEREDKPLLKIIEKLSTKFEKMQDDIQKYLEYCAYINHEANYTAGGYNANKKIKAYNQVIKTLPFRIPSVTTIINYSPHLYQGFGVEPPDVLF